MSDLIEFLRARLDEDERTAMLAALPDGQDWILRDRYDKRPSLAFLDSPPSAEHVRHIARHDPARVLREVEAKRQVVAEHEGYHSCGAWEVASGPDPSPGAIAWCKTLLSLAAVYADHPDYREEWRP